MSGLIVSHHLPRVTALAENHLALGAIPNLFQRVPAIVIARDELCGAVGMSYRIPVDVEVAAFDLIAPGVVTHDGPGVAIRDQRGLPLRIEVRGLDGVPMIIHDPFPAGVPELMQSGFAVQSDIRAG